MPPLASVVLVPVPLYLLIAVLVVPGVIWFRCLIRSARLVAQVDFEDGERANRRLSIWERVRPLLLVTTWPVSLAFFDDVGVRRDWFRGAW